MRRLAPVTHEVLAAGAPGPERGDRADGGEAPVPRAGRRSPEPAAREASTLSDMAALGGRVPERHIPGWGATIAACLSLLLVIGGCSDGGGGAGGSGGGGGAIACTPDLASIEETIFRPSCAQTNCHAGSPAAADLDLSGSTSDVLVGAASATCQGAVRVVPGSPASSLLFQKLEGEQSCGGQMPPLNPLPDEQRACVEAWIAGLPPGAGTGGAAP